MVGTKQQRVPAHASHMFVLTPVVWNYALAQQFATPQAALALGLSTALGILSWGLRAVTAGGALTGIVLTSLFCIAAGPQALVPVLCLFLLTFIATRLGHAEKERQGVAERKKGRRSTQIIANVGVAVICAAPILLFEDAPYGLLMIGASAALAEAAADTVSSEIGQWIGQRPYMITTMERVETGTDGGITLVGTFVGIVAAMLVAASCVWARLLAYRWLWLVILCATLGMLVDSVLGATLERKGRLGNDGVNYSSSAISAILALGTAFLLVLR
ncbi:MAG TPA: DUF92 domain-containing protein [Candidatus Acidoferrales bacterium]|nr:DUF92 domain-containing protein [Candidatus Acidoferrales bacterium]